LLHQALITLGDDESALLLTVAGMIGIGEEGRRLHEEFRLLKRLDIWEVYVTSRVAKAPHRRIAPPVSP
jgi:hypothetical protein